MFHRTIWILHLVIPKLFYHVSILFRDFEILICSREALTGTRWLQYFDIGMSAWEPRQAKTFSTRRCCPSMRCVCVFVLCECMRAVSICHGKQIAELHTSQSEVDENSQQT